MQGVIIRDGLGEEEPQGPVRVSGAGELLQCDEHYIGE